MDGWWLNMLEIEKLKENNHITDTSYKKKIFNASQTLHFFFPVHAFKTQKELVMIKKTGHSSVTSSHEYRRRCRLSLSAQRQLLKQTYFKSYCANHFSGKLLSSNVTSVFHLVKWFICHSENHRNRFDNVVSTVLTKQNWATADSS